MSTTFSLTDVFGPTLIQNQNGSVVELPSTTSLTSKLLFLYFSASWCGPCKAFSPFFNEQYTAVKASPLADKVEFVFVSRDQDQEQFDEYFKKFTCPAVKFDETRCEELADRFNVTGIPSVVVIRSDGTVVSRDGRTVLVKERTAGLERLVKQAGL